MARNGLSAGASVICSERPCTQRHDQRTTRSGNRMKVDQGLDEVMPVLKELKAQVSGGPSAEICCYAMYA